MPLETRSSGLSALSGRGLERVSRAYADAASSDKDGGAQEVVFPSSGVAENGKIIFSWDQAAAHITRDDVSWTFVQGGAVVVTYAFRATAPATMPDGTSGFSQFTAAQIAAAEAALALWSDAANITFVRVGGSGYSDDATILFGNYSAGAPDASAFAFYPWPTQTGASAVEGDIWVNISLAANNELLLGQFGPHILAHEIGHAIGLSHPGNYNGGSPNYTDSAMYWQDARMFTVMSYFGSTNTGGLLPAFAGGPQLHDIAAVQLLYGANTDTRTGDTIYGFNSNSGRPHYTITSSAQGLTFAIWDGGGNDTLDLSGYDENAEIDLRPEGFTSAGPTDTGPARYNISIARGVAIENAIGGAGDDLIIGNDANNRLIGNDGADTLQGGLGHDQLTGGSGADALIAGDGFDYARYDGAAAGVVADLASGGTGGDAAGDTYSNVEGLIGSGFDDTLSGNDGVNDMHGQGGADYMYGRGGDDALIGGAGHDHLIGGAGADILDGGDGFDYARYDTAAAGLTADLADTFGTTGEGLGDVFSSIEGVVGSAFDDTLKGDANPNDIHGGLGADNLYGRAHDDYLGGGAGHDHLYGGAGADILDGGDGFDYARYDEAAAGLTADLADTFGTTGEGLGDVFISIEGVVGSAFDDTLKGDANPNDIHGGLGADNLYGRAHDDYLGGGAGADHLYGGAGADILDGGEGYDYARYDDAAAGLTADLLDTFGTTGEGLGDVFISIEGVVGSAFDDTLRGDNLANDMHGQNGADTLEGRGGADNLGGEDGGDTLDGGAGADTLTGGAGNDAFVFQAGQANGDVVADFAGAGAGAGDAFVFVGYGTAAGGASFTQLDATHWQITSADGLTVEILTLANGAAIDPSDYSFGGG